MDTIYTIYKDEYPFLLQQINDPPEKLYVRGQLPKLNAKVLCVVGARRHSSYGKEACEKLISGLRGENICIVSGMALGIDSLAHRSAMEAGLQTIAFPGSGLDQRVLYPYKNKKLAEEIVEKGGALISEYEMMHPAELWTFPRRNRLMAGISDATLVIEAEEKSGTLITSRLALGYFRDVGTVPGPIFSPLSEGPNNLIADGAKMIRDSNDILELLDLRLKENEEIKRQNNLFSELNSNEKKILGLLKVEPHTNEQLIDKSDLSAREINGLISSLEIQDLIESASGKFKIK